MYSITLNNLQRTDRRYEGNYQRKIMRICWVAVNKAYSAATILKETLCTGREKPVFQVLASEKLYCKFELLYLKLY